MNAKRHITATLVAATLGLGATTWADAANIGFSLNEYSATNVLTSSLPGVLVAPQGPESWILDFSATPLDFSIAGPGYDLVWVDAEPGYLNRVTVLDPKHLLAESDIDYSAFVPTVNSFCGTQGPMLNGVTCIIGNDPSSNDLYFVTWKYPAPVPVPAAVWLFGSALGTLGWMRKRRLSA